MTPPSRCRHCPRPAPPCPSENGCDSVRKLPRGCARIAHAGLSCPAPVGRLAAVKGQGGRFWRGANPPSRRTTVPSRHTLPRSPGGLDQRQHGGADMRWQVGPGGYNSGQVCAFFASRAAAPAPPGAVRPVCSLYENTMFGRAKRKMVVSAVLTGTCGDGRYFDSCLNGGAGGYIHPLFGGAGGYIHPPFGGAGGYKTSSSPSLPSS